MSTPKSELAEKFNELLNEAFANDDALKYWWDLVYAVQYFDDLRDNDVDCEPQRHEEIAFLVLVKMPNNKFFQGFSNYLIPAVLKDLLAWEHATQIEEQAHGMCNPEHPLLQHSFELRNGLFDMALYIVELLHGRERRREISLKFMAISRDYEDFEDYVRKITSPHRPAKQET